MKKVTNAFFFFAVLPLFCSALFSCPLTGVNVAFYNERCVGNNFTTSFGVCPLVDGESFACSEYADISSFSFCHECSGKAVCSDNTDKNAVCADVSANRCDSVNYEVSQYPCQGNNQFSGGWKVCSNGQVTTNTELTSCVEQFDNTVPQCLNCADGVELCAEVGTTCSSLGLDGDSSGATSGDGRVSLALILSLGYVLFH